MRTHLFLRLYQASLAITLVWLLYITFLRAEDKGGPKACPKCELPPISCPTRNDADFGDKTDDEHNYGNKRTVDDVVVTNADTTVNTNTDDDFNANDNDNTDEIQTNSQTPRKQRKILINFGHNCCKRAQPRNCETGLSVGGFDECRAYNMSSIDPYFYELHKAQFRSPQSSINIGILDQKRGGGYWLWKPYIIFKTMEESQPGDIIFYADAGSHFYNHTQPIFDFVNKHEVVVWDMPGLPEKQWTKRDTFILMNADEQAYAEASQVLAAFVVVKNTWKAKLFVTQWLTYASDPRAVTDLANQLGKDNYPGYKAHRHDQSILSILCHKWGIYVSPIPMDQFIKHTRNKD